ncbi:MAG: NAD(P)H-dependent oxidoreductase [Bacteroidia bacterium]|nr:NAD(P)H-dependent oxidoreductase [Bacteroidia bacterium]
MKNRITLILGTTRQHNESQKVARYLLEKIEAAQLFEVDYLDLAQIDLPLLDERLTHHPQPPRDLVIWNEKIGQARGILIVAPEYKGSYPGSLKNFFDFLPQGAFRYKPVGVSTVSSGAYGGVNCLAQLRLLALSMGGLPIPDDLRVPQVTVQFGEQDQPGENFATKADKFLHEFAGYVKALSRLIE